MSGKKHVSSSIVSIFLCSAVLTLFSIVLATAGELAVSDEKSIELTGGWWQEPAERTRHTTLVCSFDDAKSNDADFAREMRGTGGFGMNAQIEGRHGLATEVVEKGGHLNFVGGSNFQAVHGTVRMFVKGEVWSDKTPRWLFEARGTDRIGVRREPGKLSLIFSAGRKVNAPIAQLDLDIGEVSASQWHSVVASWDRVSGNAWLAFNGRGISDKMEFPDDLRPAFVIYLAGSSMTRDGMNDQGLAIDDFVLYDRPLPVLETQTAGLASEDQEFLLQAEAGARRTLNFVAGLQRWGGWQTLYTWPTLLGSSAQGRHFVDFDDYLDNDKGNGSPRTGMNFVYGYEVLGDYSFLGVALRTADFLLAAQDERGFWVHGYRMTTVGITPQASDRHIKFQDQVQAHPMCFLAAMHRLTGDQRYLDSAMRAGEFYLAAQNPNGSWSHHFDAQEGMGKNAVGQPHGGELNDGAMNDAINMMALMFHITGDGKYVQAMKRAGDWLIDAQGKDVPLWADQYDGDDNPAWARHFEPAAYAASGTRLACKALVEMYRFSGDDRYLEPIRRAIRWLEQNSRDGQMSHFVDPATGRPIAAWERKVYFLDEPESLEFLETVPIGIWYTQKYDMLESTRKYLRTAMSELPSLPEMTMEAAVKSLPGLRAGAERALGTQNEAGVWVTPKVANFMGSIGAGFGATVPRLPAMLRYIERARIAMGELAQVYRGDGDMIRAAYPAADWYDVHWTEHTQ
ncbi:pectate lyase [Candidatus Poribacteria bacterium]